MTFGLWNVRMRSGLADKRELQFTTPHTSVDNTWPRLFDQLDRKGTKLSVDVLINNGIYRFGHVEIDLVVGMPYPLFTPWYGCRQRGRRWCLDPEEIRWTYPWLRDSGKD
jgi:hypothetical protein